jgi:hypothetical protein
VGEAEGEPAEGVRRRREEAEAMARSQGAVGLAERAAAALRGERWSGAADQDRAVGDPSTSSPSSA